MTSDNKSNRHAISHSEGRLIVGMVLAILIYNTTGRRAWEKYTREHEGAGQSINLRDIAPPEIPDEENKVATPFWTLLFETNTAKVSVQSYWPDDFDRANRLVRSYIWERKPNSTTNHKLIGPDHVRMWAAAINLVSESADQIELTDEQVEAMTGKEAADQVIAYFDLPLLKEIRAASVRPKARYPINYAEMTPRFIRTPHLRQVKKTCEILNLRITAHLISGDINQAGADLDLMMSIAGTLKGEPILVSHHTLLTCLQASVSCFKQGQDFGSVWPDSTLAKWQNIWNSFELIEDMHQNLMLGERVYVNRMISFARNRNDWPRSFDVENISSEITLLWILPDGLYYREQTAYNQLFDQFLEFETIKNQPHLNPTRITSLDIRLKKESLGMLLWNHHLSARMLLSTIPSTICRTAQTQATLDMASLSCALERYRLSEGQYPDQLADLVPRFTDSLRNDIVSDKPYRYRLNPDDTYTLWSIGWNEVDDQGEVAMSRKEGDWVW